MGKSFDKNIHKLFREFKSYQTYFPSKTNDKYTKIYYAGMVNKQARYIHKLLRKISFWKQEHEVFMIFTPYENRKKMFW